MILNLDVTVYQFISIFKSYIPKQFDTTNTIDLAVKKIVFLSDLVYQIKSLQIDAKER